MISVPGYSIEQTLHVGPRSSVYRARRAADGAPVILKSTSPVNADPSQSARLRYAFELGRDVGNGAVCGALDLVETEHRPVLVLEDVGGTSMDRWLRRGLDLAESLDAGRQIAEGLAALHEARIVHRDINPSNVVRNEEGRAQIIDFDIASRLRNERTQAGEPGRLQGTLAYISPEQTGRMNRAVDQRSDLYSLGVTLFQMFSGRLPFQEQDPMALVHAHIATPPPRLEEVAPGTPRPVADLVDRLLRKTPEDRVQSAARVAAELAEASRQLRETGTVGELAVTVPDQGARLHVSQQLYGRAEETAKLLEGFELAVAGGVHLVLVAGWSGIGKSSLVRELHRPLTERRGRFAAGKFDQYQNLPYAALVEALQQLASDLLVLPDEQLAGRRWRLEQILGGLLPVAVDAIPPLAALVGEKPAPTPLPPAEARVRFQLTVRRLLAALATPEEPLALFLDDLQWADSSSLALIQSLLGDVEIGNLLVLGAYRSNEVGEGHELSRLMSELDKAGAAWTKLELEALGRDAVGRMVADSLSTSPEAAADLADAIYAKTRGNPFFVERYLDTLFEEGALRTHDGRWRWDLGAVEALGVSDHVADLMARNIARLPPSSQATLQRAACVGNSFDLRTLATTCATDAAQAASALWPAIEAGLISPIGDAYRLFGVRGAVERPAEVRYRFEHDRIQEAAYSQVDGPERAATHLAVGRLLLADAGDPGSTDQLLEIVDHLNRGRAGIEDGEELRRLRTLNHRAGRAASAAGAYREALAYLDEAAKPAPELAEDRFELFELARDRAEVAGLSGEHERSEALFLDAIERSEDAAEAATVLGLLVSELMVQSRHQDAIDAALDGIARFGFELPADVSGWGDAAAAEGAALAEAMGGRFIASLVDLPACEDRFVRAELALLSRFAPVSLAFPHLTGFVLTRSARLVVQHGWTPEATTPVGWFGFIAGLTQGWPVGDAWARLALDVNTRQGAGALRPPLHHLYGTYICPWNHGLDEAYEHLQVAVQSAMESGLLLVCGWALANLPWHEAAMGVPLPDAYDNARRYLDVARSTLKFPDITAAASWSVHTLLRLLGREGERLAFERNDLSETAILESLEHYPMMRACLHAVRLQAYVILQDWPAARAEVELARATLPTAVGMVSTSEIPLYQALTWIQCRDAVSEEQRAAWDAELPSLLATLKGFEASQARNNRYKVLLLEAELARLRGDDADASRLFDDAIDEAQTHSFLAAVGVACERAAEFHRAAGRGRVARSYRAEAHETWSRFGCPPAVQRLEAQDARLRVGGGAGRTVRTTGETGTVGATGTADIRSLDLFSVLKATEAISSEIHLDRLLERMINLMVENAGGQRGLLILREGEQLLVQARLEPGETPVVLEGRPVDQAPLLQGVVRLAARSRKQVVLADASRSPRFGDDPYVRERGPRSVLCSPIHNQGRLVGLLYVENNLTDSAFTEDRRTLLDVLGTQAAIAIENARLYDSVSRFVPTEFLSLLGARSILEVGLGDSIEREMNVLFADIRGFTTLAEQLPPADTFGFLNGWLARVGPIVRSHGGFVDKYIGDAVMALFPGRPEDAIGAAMAMQRAAAEYRAELAGRFEGVELRVGVGLHRGLAMLGTIGEAARLEGTVISDAVNTASRLEAASKELGVGIVVSGSFLARLENADDWPHRYLGRRSLRGRAEATELFEVLVDLGSAN